MHAEYIAHSEDRLRPNYALSDAVAVLNDKGAIDQLWVGLHDGMMLPRSYVCARVAVEHLLEHKQLSYEDIIHSSFTESVFMMMLWRGLRIKSQSRQNKAMCGELPKACRQQKNQTQRCDDRDEGFNDWYLETLMESAKQLPPIESPPRQAYLPEVGCGE